MQFNIQILITYSVDMGGSFHPYTLNLHVALSTGDQSGLCDLKGLKWVII